MKGNLENVIAIELQDSKEHIFERLVFSDENDNAYKDDEYKGGSPLQVRLYKRTVYKNIRNG